LIFEKRKTAESGGFLGGALGRKFTDFDNSLIFHKTLK